MKPGIYDISNETYHASEGISRSGISLLKKSPIHYWDRYINEDKAEKKSTRSLDFGSLLHNLILEPENINTENLTAAGKRALEEAELAKKSILNDPVAARLVSGGLAEKSIYWNDEDTGVLCKARPDMWFKGVVVDLKSTACARKDKYRWSMFDYDYHIQAAMMIDGISAVTGETPEEFIHVVVENKRPYAVAVYPLLESTIQRGRDEYKRLLEIYLECVNSNYWPSYQNEDCYI